MKFINKIKELLKNKNVVDNTINKYINDLIRLNNEEEFKNLNFLKNKENINEFLSKYKETTKRNYYISIVSVLNEYKKENKTFIKLYDYYYNILKELNKNIRDELNKNEKTTTQEKNWMDYEELKNIHAKLLDEIEDFNLYKKLNKKQYEKLLNALILSLYMYQDPRRNKDYVLMMIKNNNNIDDNNQYNYLDLNHNIFKFYNYKTSKKYGFQDVKINSDLMTIINLYLKFHPLYKKNNKNNNTKFLVYYDGKAFIDNSITRILNKITNKKIGSSMIRHIFLSQDKFLDQVKKMKNISENMGHSTGQQVQYMKE